MGNRPKRNRKALDYVLLLLGVCIAYTPVSLWGDFRGDVQRDMDSQYRGNIRHNCSILVRTTSSQQMGEMINAEGLELIKDFEGFEADPYKDVAGIWTIGFGSIYGQAGKRVTQDHPSITRDQAVELMARDLQRTEDRVARLIKVPVTENQFAALCSFAYNVGTGAFQRSTARMKLNRQDYLGCANELLRWKYAGKKVVQGLLRRREAERQLFLSEDT